MDRMDGCPFCGGEVKVWDTGFGVLNIIECTNCHTRFLFPWYEDGNVLFEKWNRRVSDSAAVLQLKLENAILKKNADEAFQQGLNESADLFEPEIRKVSYKTFYDALMKRVRYQFDDENQLTTLSYISANDVKEVYDGLQKG